MATDMNSAEGSSGCFGNHGGRDRLEASTTSEQFDTTNAEDYREKQRFGISPTSTRLLGSFDIFCLVMNCTIGSGIFTVPTKVLAGTGSVGASLLLWLASGVTVLCAVLCWLELGLSLPMHTVNENDSLQEISAPRSGSNKGYLEFFYKKPAFLITCVFGILFIVLGNVSGNAMAFGIYIMIAAGKDPVNSSTNNYEKGPIMFLAITVSTACCLFHFFWRRGGILVNNAFAIAKVGMLLVIISLGFIQVGGKYLRTFGIIEPPLPQSSPFVMAGNFTIAMIKNATDINFEKKTGFQPGGDISSFVRSFLLGIYPYSGFEQPLYVLSEVSNPRKVLPKAATTAMLTTILLYMLVNISYFCVVPKEVLTQTSEVTIDIATAFFGDLFGSTYGPHVIVRAMAALIAFSILGNILVLTFTAAQFKKEISKEGILPKFFFFATSHKIPWTRFWNRPRSSLNPKTMQKLVVGKYLEKSPLAALALHWFSSVILIVFTAMLRPANAYSFLVSLYSYANMAVLGSLTGGGMLYLKIESQLRRERGRNWCTKARWTPFLDPLLSNVIFVIMAFFMSVAFVNQVFLNRADKVTQHAWFLVPAIGLSSLLWGVAWWFGLGFVHWNTKFQLQVERIPIKDMDNEGVYVYERECKLVDLDRSWLWQRRVPSARFWKDRVQSKENTAERSRQLLHALMMKQNKVVSEERRQSDATQNRAPLSYLHDLLFNARYQSISLANQFGRATFSTFINVADKIVLLMQTWARFLKSEPLQGHRRIFWRCGCEKIMYVDVPYISTEQKIAADSLCQKLRGSFRELPSDTKSETSPTVSTSSDETLSYETTGMDALDVAADLDGKHDDQHPIKPVATERDQDQALDRSVSPREDKFLAVCVNRGKYLKVLCEIAIQPDIRTDQDLFREIGARYQKLRGLRSRFWLFVPAKVHYVQLAVDARHQVGILATPLALPPQKRVLAGDYHYDPCPLTGNIPVPNHIFMHYLTCSDPGSGDCWMSRLPKKLKTSITHGTEPMKYGWGIHIDESPNFALISLLNLCVLAISGFVAALWSHFRDDFQGAFGFASWIIAGTNSVIAVCLFGVEHR